eukprot:6195515-Pleurochrysis_carterae.AAC.1
MNDTRTTVFKNKLYTSSGQPGAGRESGPSTRRQKTQKSSNVTNHVIDRYNSLAAVRRLITAGLGSSLTRLGRVSGSGGPRARPLANTLSLP